MKTKEIRELETGHLLHELGEKQKHLFDLRTQAVTEKLEDPSQLVKTKREIARLKTILRQRHLAGDQAASGQITTGKKAGSNADASQTQEQA